MSVVVRRVKNSAIPFSPYSARVETGLEMVTDTVTNATKRIQLATRSFQAVAKLVTSSKLTTHDIADYD